MTFQNPIQEVLSEYHKRLQEILGSELKSVILYGSHARGEGQEESDIDVLCVMKDSLITET